MTKTFGVVVNFITGAWGYEIHEGDKFIGVVEGCKSYEEAFEKATAEGYKWECEQEA